MKIYIDPFTPKNGEHCFGCNQKLIGPIEVSDGMFTYDAWSLTVDRAPAPPVWQKTGICLGHFYICLGCKWVLQRRVRLVSQKDNTIALPDYINPFQARRYLKEVLKKYLAKDVRHI